MVFTSATWPNSFALRGSKRFPDPVSTGSGSDLVNGGSQNRQKYLIPIADQVATAPCADWVQPRRPTVAKPGPIQLKELKLDGQIFLRILAEVVDHFDAFG